MRRLTRYRIILDFNNYDLPLFEITRLLDSLLSTSNIALYFSRAIVPKTEEVLQKYLKQFEVKVIKKKDYENSDYIVIFKKIKSNLQLLELLKQHGLNLYYIKARKYDDFDCIEKIFEEKDGPLIDLKLFELVNYEMLVYFDIDRTIDISFDSEICDKNSTFQIIMNWLKSMKVKSYDIKEIE